MGILDLLGLRDPTDTLFAAAKASDVSRAKDALRRGAKPSAREPTEGQTPLHVALRSCEARSGDGAVAYRPTPRAQSSVRETTELVRLLLEAGSNPNATDNDGVTPLHWAAGKGMTTAAQMLIAAGAKVNARDSVSFTPLHNAAQGGWCEVARVLLSAGADTTARHSGGQTPLEIVPIVVAGSGPDSMAPMRTLLREYATHT